MSGSESPMMMQYNSIKKQHTDAILFFRLGDFYEMFNDDAKIASKVLEITLTTRNKNNPAAIPLCGIPFHSADNYISKLVKRGYKVAICEQTEDPKKAKGIVKREVIKVVTPGTYLNANALESKENNYLCGICFEGKTFGYALLDLSTGEFIVNEFSGIGSKELLLSEIVRTDPKEILLPESVSLEQEGGDVVPADYTMSISRRDDLSFDHDTACKRLLIHFGVASLAGFGCDEMRPAISAAGAVIHYIQETQQGSLSHITRLSVHNSTEYMKLDAATMKTMELVKRDHDGGKEGSLYGLLDLTMTSMGGRKLKQWITKPLIHKKKIVRRHEVVECFHTDLLKRKQVREFLAQVYDLERIVSKVHMRLAGPRDLVSLRNSLSVLSEIESLLSGIEAAAIKKMIRQWDNLQDIATVLEEALIDDPPVTLKDGGYIKMGFNPELDEVKGLTRERREVITTLEMSERKKTGIQTLKIRFNTIYGYYIEVTKKNLSSVPDTYIRKQSLTNAERFITPELKEFEEKVISAEEKMKELEVALFEDICGKVLQATERIQKMASVLSTIDVLVSFAEAANKFNYSKPAIETGDVLEIKEGRHPVVEQMNAKERFIPNDTCLDCRHNQVAIITGPNMAGKSTYLRQVGLITLMAQIGSFVPANKAEIGIVDRIFTRIGAHDDLVKGQSTFMVEMSETANILHNATKKSLLILDEIGRGTSTFDGISIAWAIVEFIIDKGRLGARTLFATHYFELTELAQIKESITNYNIAIKEWNDEILFLRKINKGSADKSYGIQVARLAGLPSHVITRAKKILAKLESNEAKDIKKEQKLHECKQLDLFLDKGYDSVVQEIRHLRIEELTPIQALNKLNELKGML